MSTTPATSSYKLPVRPLHNPLTDEDRAALEHVLTRLAVAEDMIHRAAACGLDCVERLARHDMHKHVAHKIKGHFFPDQLPATNE